MSGARNAIEYAENGLEITTIHISPGAVGATALHNLAQTIARLRRYLALRMAAVRPGVRNGVVAFLVIKLLVLAFLWPAMWRNARCNFRGLDEAPLWDTRYLDWTEREAFSAEDEIELREFLAWREPQRGVRVRARPLDVHKVGLDLDNVDALRATQPLVIAHVTRDSVSLAVHWACRAHAAALAPRLVALDGAETCDRVRAQAEWVPCLALQTRGFLHPVHAAHFVSADPAEPSRLSHGDSYSYNHDDDNDANNASAENASSTSESASIAIADSSAPAPSYLSGDYNEDGDGVEQIDVASSAETGIALASPLTGAAVRGAAGALRLSDEPVAPSRELVEARASAALHAALVQRARFAWRVLALGHDLVLSEPDVVFASNATFRFADYVSADADLVTLESGTMGLRGRVLRAAIDLFGYTNPNFGLVYARSNARTIGFFQLLHMQQARELHTPEYAYAACARVPWRRITVAHFRRDLFVDGAGWHRGRSAAQWRRDATAAARVNASSGAHVRPVAVHLSALAEGTPPSERRLSLLARWGLYERRCRASLLDYDVEQPLENGPRLFDE